MKALILGGTSSVAVETAKLLLNDGWHLTLSTRNQGKMEEVEMELQEHAMNIDTLIFDAAKTKEHISEIRTKALEYDAVLCFIGYLPDESTPFSSEEIQEVMDVNLTSILKILDIFSEAFEKRGSGSILGVSSVAGDRGKAKNLLYSSAKAGFTAYLSGLRNKLSKKGISVISVIPGYMDTEMTKGMELPKSLTVSPRQAATTIFKAFKKGKSVVYVSWKWRWLMLIIKHLPEGVYKKMNF